MIRLFTDSDTDMTPEMAKEHGYSIISMPYSYDGNTYFPYEDFDVFKEKEFYDMLRGGVIPTTSAISAAKYIEYFDPVLAQGDDILYVHFSRAMSMTFECLDEAIKLLATKYPDRKIYTIDTKEISVGSLNMVLEIGDMVKAGTPIEEILKWAETEIYRFAIYFFADDLKFFKKSGRVKGIAATMGNMIGIRPIIYIGNDGKMENIGKERGRENALNRIISYVRELGDEIEKHRILIAHADAPELSAMVKEKLIENFGDKLNIIEVIVNPTIGCHCGPNSVGVSFHATRR